MRTLFVVAAFAACSSPAAPPPVARRPEVPMPPVRVPDPVTPGLRLPMDVVPHHYALDLTIVPGDPIARVGTTIDANVMTPTFYVWLNATDLSISSARIDGEPARIILGDADHVGLTLDRRLERSAIRIEIVSSAKIDPQKSRGIYSEKEGPDTYVYSFFEPIDARRAFPCFDEPSVKVPWQLTFHVKANHVALANAPVISETPEPNGMKRVELAESKPLPSYLVAFVVGPFELVDGGKAGRANTPIRFVIPKGRAGELGYAKEVTPKVVKALEDYFDMAYPYVKLDVAVVPRYWGTMEHPGIVAMGQPLTLIRPDQATRERKLAYLNILAHELAHYWFGDYVTLAWWDDTWLNESLGEWMDLIITDAVAPEWEVLDQRVGRGDGAMTADETLSTMSVRQPVTTREQVESSFDGAIIYLKGSTVTRMFEYALGRDKWRDFIRGYMAKHAWKNATADDLFAAAKAAFGADVERGLRSFVDQPGVPRISAELSCKKITLHQTRSLPAGVTDPVKRLWTVPVCVKYGDAKTTHRSCTMLSAADGELTLEGACPTWYLLNADATGYYRSMIDLALAKQVLASGKLTNAEKILVLMDIHGAVTRGELTADAPLALAPLYAKDPADRVTRQTAIALELRGDGLDDPLHAKYVAYYVKTLKPLAAKLGWKRRVGDTDERHELRRMAMSVAYHDAAMQKEAQKLALGWLADRATLDDDMVDSVLSAAGHHGDAALYDKILAAAKTPRDRTEQERMIYALGYFADPTLVARSLALVTGTELDLRETKGILYVLLAARETRPAVLAFLETTFDSILGRMRDDEATWMLRQISESACDQATYDRVRALTETRSKKIGGAETAVTRGLEQSRQCITNMQRQLPALRKFL